MSNKLTHIDPHGNAHMVNISEKKSTCRKAVACGKVIMNHQTLLAITEQRVKKGDVLHIAQLAGIMGAKHTSDLIPLCHPIPIDGVDVELTVQAASNGEVNKVGLKTFLSCSSKTGCYYAN